MEQVAGPDYCTVSVRKAAGCTEPLAAITETVDVVGRGKIGSTPQPVQRPNPSPAAIATDSRFKPRRFFQPKQHNTTASAELGKNGLELRERAAAAVDTAMVSVVEATAPDGVTVAGAKLHEVPAGNPEQLNETEEAKPFCGATKTVTVPLCLAVTVRAAGKIVTAKVGAARSMV
jgi:hypothetical protein